MADAVAAVDLGATSGRVMLGYVGDGELRLAPVARFPNTPVATVDGLHWNILELYRNVVAGLGDAVRADPGLRNAAVDSWAVDYALMRHGAMLGTPYHYRDDRTATGVARTHQSVGPEELYRENGLQFLPFNTNYQLAADQESGLLPLADGLLLIPDLIAYWLTGEQVAERTNASTTGLLDPVTREWNDGLIRRLGLPRHILPSLVDPGTALGPARAELGLGSRLTVGTVGSHDTASAVVAVPATTDGFAYISCGTWGLVGVELEHPLISAEARAANFTNEGGVDGRVRFLHNVMGLWLLSESVRTWERDGDTIDLPALLSAAAAVPTPVPVFDADDERFLAPGDLPARIAAWFSEHGMPAPTTRAEYARSILESLAEAFARGVREAATLSEVDVRTVHIVGGGAQNDLLCRLTANRCGMRVLAGPVEATALGNVLVQARAQSLVHGRLEDLRALVAATHPPREYLPDR